MIEHKTIVHCDVCKKLISEGNAYMWVTDGDRELCSECAEKERHKEKIENLSTEFPEGWHTHLQGKRGYFIPYGDF